MNGRYISSLWCNCNEDKSNIKSDTGKYNEMKQTLKNCRQWTRIFVIQFEVRRNIKCFLLFSCRCCMAERGEGEGREVTDAEDAEWVSIECSFHFEKNRIETIKHALNSCSNKRRGTYGEVSGVGVGVQHWTMCKTRPRTQDNDHKDAMHLFMKPYENLIWKCMQSILNYVCPGLALVAICWPSSKTH